MIGAATPRTGDQMLAGRPLSEALAQCEDMVQPAMRAAVDTLPTSIRRIAGYHLGWWDRHGRPAGADGGKGIRQALVLLSADAVGGARAEAVPAAVAVALVHNFTLIHDDVLDGDHLRRHRPTAWSVFGIGEAILAGDALLALACDVIAASGQPAAPDVVRTLMAAVVSVLEGQRADISFEARTDVGMAECVQMAEQKTAALMGCACAVGAMSAGASRHQVECLRAFGQNVGLAYQHVDDLLGIWGDPAVTGKPAHSDLRNRKKSLPVVAALTSDSPAGQELATVYASLQMQSALDLAGAADLIDLSGGRRWSQGQIDELLTCALGNLRAADPRAEPSAQLEAIARLMARRDH